ncbi:helix-turn-helix domain-containing protein [Microbacterium sp. E-13]|uniref:helix-turn-helix domain-containing protein n=1 Tax=Microbacterium sp. E-13 TaxID=3404048 RepID=UPI003CEF2F39
MARAGHYRIAELAELTRLPRRTVAVDQMLAGIGFTHGTPRGYRRGCRRAEICVNVGTFDPTCTEANRAYMAAFRERRRAGEGHAAPHGTRAGFLAGCRDEEFCPRNDSGESCLSVARLYARDWKRAVRHSGPEPAMAPELMDAVLRLYVSGYSHRQIARAGDIGKSTVGRYLQLARAGQYCPMPHQIIAGFRRAVASLS